MRQLCFIAAAYVCLTFYMIMFLYMFMSEGDAARFAPLVSLCVFLRMAMVGTLWQSPPYHRLRY